MCASSWPLILSGCRFISPFYVSLGHSTVSAKCRLHLWVKSEDFFTFTIFSWDFTIPCTLISDLFLVLSIPLFFFIPFIMIVGWMVHINSIRSPFHLVLGSPIPILAISHGIILWFIESPGFKIVKPLIITLVEVLSCCYGFGFCCLLLLNCWKYRSFFFHELDRRVVRARILVSLASVLVHSVDATMVLYFSVALWMSYPYGDSITVSQSSLFLSMERLKFEFGPKNRALKMCQTYSLWISLLYIMTDKFEDMS